MKYICLILSVLMLFLSTASSFIEDVCLIDTNIECIDSDLTDNQETCPDNCSPFVHCNTCSGFPVHISKCHLEPILSHSNNIKISIYTTSFSSGFNSKIWQPPQS